MELSPPPKKKKKHVGKVKMRMSQVSFLECIQKHHSIVSSPTLLESKRSRLGRGIWLPNSKNKGLS